MLSEARLVFASLHQLLLPLLGGLELLPDPQRKALEAAFGIVEGDAPDLFLIGLAALGLVAERAAETPLLFVIDDVKRAYGRRNAKARPHSGVIPEHWPRRDSRRPI
jgi:hypothetical protein